MPGRSRRMKGMVGIGEQPECGPSTDPINKSLEKIRVREFIARPLKEEHRNRHREQMLAPLSRWAPRLMKWKPEECEPTNALKRRFGMRLRGHASAERLSACEQRKLRKETRSLGHSGTDGCPSRSRSIRPL